MDGRITPNRFDKDGSNLKQGLRAEHLFAQIAKAKGWEVYEPSNYQDINEHWDIEIRKNGKSYKVDVKAMKKLNRKDSIPQDEWHWVELHGVRKYDKGWLYGGKADLIAFETKTSFIIVRRQDLIELVEDKVDFSTKVEFSSEAKYKVYQRRNRHDKLTLMKTSDLREIKIAEWEKLK
jgi:hypothetical protein